MATTRGPRLLASSLLTRSNLLLLLALISILSRHSAASAAAAEFEGFDSDDIDDASSDSDPLHLPIPPPTTLTPEFHHEPNPPPPPSEPNPPPPSSFEFWDEDEFEGIPLQIPNPDPLPQTQDSAPSNSTTTGTSASPSPRPSIWSYTVEIAAITFLLAFIANYFLGRSENERLALAWAARFATKDSVFDKNFSLLGTGDGVGTPLLLKEGQDVFKFYASGRRYCQGLLATMELRARHDLISRVSDLILGRRDTITFEVLMNEDAMDHVVVAVAGRKVAKVMHKEVADLQRFGNVVASPPSGRKWIADGLSVISESKEVAGDVITDVVIDQVFGERAFEKYGKWFISLHFSDQNPSSQKKTLEFKFALPDAKNMVDMTRLVTLVPYYIDLIGRYKLSSQARSKTETARAKAAQEAYKELQNARQEALQKRKAEKKKLIEEAEAMLSAEAIRKKEEKERARQLKKSAPKVKKVR